MGLRPAYEAGARELGARLAASGTGLVFGGASVGLMGAVADATLAAGGEAIGYAFGGGRSLLRVR